MNNTIEYLNKNDGSIGIDGILRANGDFPLTNANQVKGGMHHFNTIQERDAMPILKASPGMLAYVIETDIHYKLIYENDSFVWKKIVDREEIQTFFNGGEGITYNNNTGEISLTYLRSNNNVLEYSDGENWNSVIGDITSINVTTGLGLQGGASGTIGDITGNISLNHLGLENLIDPNSNSIFYWNNSTKKSEFLNIGDGLLINSGVLSNTIINNDQLINGSGYITADSSDTLTNKSGNISQWTNDVGYITDGNTNWNNTYGFITGINWDEITGNQLDINLSGFNNDSGFTTFDGDYNSLSNLPTIPTNNNQLINGAGYITNGNDGWVNTYGFITGVNWDEIGGLQSDINLSGFTNDVGFVSGDEFDSSGTYLNLRAQATTKDDVGLGNVENITLSTYTGNGGSLDNQYIINSEGYITGINWDGIGGTQSDINLSGFTNDVGFSTFDGDYNSLTNIPTYTQGSIIFADSDGSLTEDNSQLYWDNVNNRLGIGTNNPTFPVQIQTGGFALAIKNYITTQNIPDSILAGWDTSAVYLGYDYGSYQIHIGSLNTGDVLVLTQGNTIVEHGKLGVSTTSPTEKLDINNGNAKINGKIYFTDIADIKTIELNPDGASYINSGNLGIGTTTPTEKLDVDGNVKANGILKLYDVTDTQTISLNPDGDSYSLGNLIIGDSNANRTVKIADDGLYISRTTDGVYNTAIKANSDDNNLDILARSSIFFKHNAENVNSLTLYDYGHVQIPTYGQGNVSGATQYVLGVSSNGTIIESEWLTNDGTSSSMRIGKGIPSVENTAYVTLIGQDTGKNASAINNFNTLIGGFVGFNSGIFQNSTIIGDAAGAFGNNYINSVIIGEQAGQQIGLNRSVAIGYRNAYSTQPQGSFNNTITIGYEVTPTANGQIIIGNNDNTSFETFGQIKNSSYGQGSVLSDFVTDETSLPVFDANGNLVESQVISINNGNVGIGTTSPNYKFDITGNFNVNIPHRSPSYTNGVIRATAGVWSRPYAVDFKIGNYTLSAHDNDLHFGLRNQGVWFSDSQMYITGIPTLRFGNRLGPNNISRLDIGVNTVSEYAHGANYPINSDNYYYIKTSLLSPNGNLYDPPATVERRRFELSAKEVVFKTGNIESEAARFNVNGNLGIGTTTPSEKLDVIGNIKADGILKLYDVTDTQKIELNPDGNSYINGGNVGIGTTNPTEKLEVNGNIKITSGGNTFFNINHGNVGAIIFKDTSISTPNEWVIQHNYSQLNDFRIARFIGGDDFVIDNNGNIGINTTTPTEKLDVNGNIKASGYINGKRCGAAGYLASPVNITVTTANTYYPIGVFTVPVAADFIVGTTYPNGLKYTGTIAQTFHITWNATIESTSNNVSSIIDIEKNGVSIPMAKMGTYSKTGGEIYNLNGQCVVDLDVNDEVRFVVTADNNGEILTFDYFTASIKEFFD